VVTRASGDNPLAGVGAAIELRSRLQRADLERRESGGGGGWEELGGAWVRLPAGRAWGALHFTGGAVLGSYPHICYDALLGSLADASGLLVIATPYDLSTDHDGIAAAVAGKLRSALGAVAAREGLSPGALPLFGLGHSLGAKLQVLCATAPAGNAAAVRYTGASHVTYRGALVSPSLARLTRVLSVLLPQRSASPRSTTPARRIR
jgi:hypothetical protein